MRDLTEGLSYHSVFPQLAPPGSKAGETWVENEKVKSETNDVNEIKGCKDTERQDDKVVDDPLKSRKEMVNE